MSQTFTLESTALLNTPNKETVTKVTSTNMPAAGFAVTPANFGLTTITKISFTAVEVGGAVNVSTLIPKYDPATGKIFFFYGQDAAAEIPAQFVVITGDISATATFHATATGT